MFTFMQVQFLIFHENPSLCYKNYYVMLLEKYIRKHNEY